MGTTPGRENALVGVLWFTSPNRCDADVRVVSSKRPFLFRRCHGFEVRWWVRARPGERPSLGGLSARQRVPRAPVFFRILCFSALVSSSLFCRKPRFRFYRSAPSAARFASERWPSS
uniref:Uncharacterized protein n=1 Tax=Ixodes ricinus TaxID=34613 RepID=A0A6B0ULU8_IXORI